MSSGFVPARGAFGQFGGMYVPELLVPALDQLETAFEEAQRDPRFQAELAGLLRDYAGRETPLYRCRNFGRGSNVIYLKREDLLHGGAHKTNQVLGQALLARRMGKTRLIAETGAGQHGVATAMAGALMGMSTRIYMGAQDVARQEKHAVVDRRVDDANQAEADRLSPCSQRRWAQRDDDGKAPEDVRSTRLEER